MPTTSRPAYSLSTVHYYPPGIPNPPSPSGPPPSHSDSPSPSSFASRRQTAVMPLHWRKVTHTIVAEDLEPETTPKKPKPVPRAVKAEAVRRYLEQSLEAHLGSEADDSGGAVLQDVLGAIMKDRSLVDRIWSLKQCQAGILPKA